MSELEDILALPAASVGRVELQAKPESVRSSFSTINPKLQIAWDSVSLGAAEKCWRYYELSIIRGWVSKFESFHLRYGQLYHRAGEVYDHGKMLGMSHEEALMSSLTDLKDGCTDTLVDGSRVWWDPSAGLSEEKAKQNTKTIPNLFRTVAWYHDKHQLDELKTIRLANGKPAVELSFRYSLGYTFETGEEMLHSGHFDKMAKLSDLTYVVDKKTTKNTISGASSYQFFAQFNPNTQMSGYTYASRVVFDQDAHGVIIDGAQIAKGFSHFERGFSMRTEGQLNEWRTNTLNLVWLAEHYAKTGYYPMNPASCNNYGGCVFRDICNKDPFVRDTLLRANFVKRPWDPLETRGDI